MARVAAVSPVDPGDRFWDVLRDLFHRAQVTGRLVTDAALAALAVEHGAILCTPDRDFARRRTAHDQPC